MVKVPSVMELKRFAGPFRLVWTRITVSRLTLLYFIFSVSHFVIQLALQISAYSNNANSHNIINTIVHDAGAFNGSLPYLRGSRLYLCSWIPSDLNVANCPIIWDGDEAPALKPDPGTLTSSSSSLRHALASLAHPIDHPETNETRSVGDVEQKFPVFVAGLNRTESVRLSQQCLWTLNWPNIVLENTQTEDSVFIAFQFWVLGVSILALLNESIPHIIASLLTHVMATAWGAVQIKQTADFRVEFKRVITNGACKQAILNPSYWTARRWLEIPSLSFNALALIISCALTWNLIKIFGWQTFKRVGPSLTINRVYKLVLSLSITIQLSLFFMVVTVSLWINQLMNDVGVMTSFVTVYKAMSCVTLLLLIPWLMTGWFGVRRELELPMFIFLFLSVLYMAGWGLMFVSTTFRWIFSQWFFFGVMASASVFLTFSAMVLGIICRLNFGKGLCTYLTSQPTFEEDRASADLEKVAFATFRSEDDAASRRSRFSDVESRISHAAKQSISKSSYHSRDGSVHSNHTQRQIIE